MANAPDPVAAAPPAALPPLRPLWRRALALVTAPRSVFEEMERRPAWFWTAVASSVVAILSAFAIYRSVILPLQIQVAANFGAPSSQLAEMEEKGATLGAQAAHAVQAGAFNLIVIVLLGLLLFAVCGFLMGGKARVRQALAVAAHAWLVHIPHSLLVLPLSLRSGDPDASLGPGVLFPLAEAQGYGARVLSAFLNNGLDLFNLWAIGLCVLGMSVVSRLPAAQAGLGIGITYVLTMLLWALLRALLPF